MHIHGTMQTFHNSSFGSMAGAERAAAAQRAAEVRKRLLKNAQTVDGDTTPEETLLIGHWLDSRHSETSNGDEYLTGDEYRSAAMGWDPELG